MCMQNVIKFILLISGIWVNMTFYNFVEMVKTLEPVNCHNSASNLFRKGNMMPVSSSIQWGIEKLEV